MILLCSSLLIALQSFAATTELISTNDAFFVQQTKPNQLRIMSYNAYNLFDAEHDEGAFDYTFLPKEYPGKQEQCLTVKNPYYQKQCLDIDWTNDKLKQKIAQLVKVFTSHGSKPDILALQEVENENVIGMLAKAAGYSKYIVTNYPSHRGIDMAVLYNPKKVSLQQEDYVKTPGRDPVRLKFEFLKNNETFYLYVNHWLAQSAPESYRQETAIALASDIKAVMQKSPNAKIFALGDFNVANDEQQVFDSTLLNPDWKQRLVDVHVQARQQFPILKKYFPDGSYYWFGAKSWWRFDRFFVSQSFLKGSGARVDLNSYRIVYSEFLTGLYTYKVDEADPESDEVTVRFPIKYNFLDIPDRPLGFSDHLPLSVLIQF